MPEGETRNDKLVTGGDVGGRARAMVDAVRRARAEVAMAGVTKEGE